MAHATVGSANVQPRLGGASVPIGGLEENGPGTSQALMPGYSAKGVAQRCGVLEGWDIIVVMGWGWVE